MSSNSPTNQPNNDNKLGNRSDLLAQAAKEAPADSSSQQTYFPQATPTTQSGINNAAIPASQNPTTMKEAKNLGPGKKSKKRLVFIIVLVLVIAAICAAAAYYFLVYQPKTVLIRYFDKITSSNTGKFSSTIKPVDTDQNKSDGVSLTSYDDFIKNSVVKLSGTYNFTDKSNPKADIKLAVTSTSIPQAGDLTTQLGIVLSDKTLYLRVDELGLLQLLQLSINKDWYKFNLDQSLSQTKCYLGTQNDGESGNFLGLKTFSNLSVKNAKRDHIREEVDGHSASHYIGEIDFSKLGTAVEETNKQLPADCKVDFNSSSFANMTVKYEIWSGSNFDRLKLTITDTKNSKSYEVIFDSSDYNSDVKIEVPEGSKDFNELLKSFYSSSNSTQLGL